MPTSPLVTRDRASADEEDLVAHYAKKTDITRAHVHGTSVRALCGKTWVPTRDGTKYPICQTCKEIYETVPD